MHAVITVKRSTDDTLVCGKRLAERLAGGVLSLLTLPFVIVAAIAVSADIPTAGRVLFVAGCLLLLGLHVAVSSRDFAFSRHSQRCTARLNVLAIFPRQRKINFSAVVIRRQFDFRLLRWLYLLVLTDQEHRPGGSFRMGYVRSLTHGQALAETIARFTNTRAVDSDGHVLTDQQDGHTTRG